MVYFGGDNSCVPSVSHFLLPDVYQHGMKLRGRGTAARITVGTHFSLVPCSQQARGGGERRGREGGNEWVYECESPGQALQWGPESLVMDMNNVAIGEVNRCIVDWL